MSDLTQKTQTILESVAGDLAKAANSASSAADNLASARDKAASASDTSIRSIIEAAASIDDRFAQAGINRKPTKDEIKAILDSMADKLTGSEATRKVRKSEIKTIVETRTHARRVIERLDEENASRGGDGQPSPLNIRQATLKALRSIRSTTGDNADILDADTAVSSIVDSHDHEPDSVEKFDRLWGRLEKFEELSSEGDDERLPHPLLSRVYTALRGALASGTMAELDEIEQVLTDNLGAADTSSSEQDSEAIEAIEAEQLIEEMETTDEEFPDEELPHVENRLISLEIDSDEESWQKWQDESGGENDKDDDDEEEHIMDLDELTRLL